MASSKPRNRPWYRIENASESEAEVLIYGQIGADWFGEGVDAKEFARDLAGITASTLRIRINSGGGSVFEGVAIAAAIERHPAHTITHIDGIAASAASRIAIASDEVRMAKDAFFMIHNSRGIAFGGAKEMRDTADLLEKINGSIRDTYVRKTGRKADEVEAWMDAETWFTADEAKDAGFVDEVEGSKAVKANADLSVFNNVPPALAARLAPEPRRIETVRDLETFLRDEGGYSNAAAKAIASRGFPALSDPRDEDGETAAIIAALHQRGEAIPTVRR